MASTCQKALIHQAVIRWIWSILLIVRVRIQYFLTHWLPCHHNQPWRAFAFVSLLMSSPLTKIGIIYTQVLLEAGKELSNDNQISKIGSMKPEICTKMLSRNFNEKLVSNIPATIPRYSVVKIAHLDDASLECFELETSPVEGQSWQQNEKKRQKRKGEKRIKTPQKPNDIGHLYLSSSCHVHIGPNNVHVGHFLEILISMPARATM